MNKLLPLLCLALALLFPAFGSADATEQFPHRARFKQVAVMELDELDRQFANVVVVDVRSRFEYDTLHIQGAVHVPLSSMEKLPAAVRELRAASDKPIVFYCNGTDCTKSYEAAELARRAGIDRVFAFDAGLDAWSRQYPARCMLLGKTPESAQALISIEDFRKRLLDTEQFEAHVEKGAVVLDIRDLRQRDIALWPMRELRAPLDDREKIAAAVAEARRLKKPLLVYDKVGKQVRWFQYYLEQQGMKDYFFLDGGAEAYHAARFGRQKPARPVQG